MEKVRNHILNTLPARYKLDWGGKVNSPIRFKIFATKQTVGILNQIWINSLTKVTNGVFHVLKKYTRCNIPYNNHTVTLSVFLNGTIMFQGKSSVEWVYTYLNQVVRDVEHEIEDCKGSLDQSGESDISNTSLVIQGICAVCDKKDTGYMVECHKCFSWTHNTCDKLTEKQARKVPEYFCTHCRKKYGLQLKFNSTPAQEMDNEKINSLPQETLQIEGESTTNLEPLNSSTPIQKANKKQTSLSKQDIPPSINIFNPPTINTAEDLQNSSSSISFSDANYSDTSTEDSENSINKPQSQIENSKLPSEESKQPKSDLIHGESQKSKTPANDVEENTNDKSPTKVTKQSNKLAEEEPAPNPPQQAEDNVFKSEGKLNSQHEEKAITNEEEQNQFKHKQITVEVETHCPKEPANDQEVKISRNKKTSEPTNKSWADYNRIDVAPQENDHLEKILQSFISIEKDDSGNQQGEIGDLKNLFKEVKGNIQEKIMETKRKSLPKTERNSEISENEDESYKYPTSVPIMLQLAKNLQYLRHQIIEKEYEIENLTEQLKETQQLLEPPTDYTDEEGNCYKDLTRKQLIEAYICLVKKFTEINTCLINMTTNKNNFKKKWLLLKYEKEDIDANLKAITGISNDLLNECTLPPGDTTMKDRLISQLEIANEKIEEQSVEKQKLYDEITELKTKVDLQKQEIYQLRETNRLHTTKKFSEHNPLNTSKRFEDSPNKPTSSQISQQNAQKNTNQNQKPHITGKCPMVSSVNGPPAIPINENHLPQTIEKEQPTCQSIQTNKKNSSQNENELKNSHKYEDASKFSPRNDLYNTYKNNQSKQITPETNESLNSPHQTENQYDSEPTNQNVVHNAYNNGQPYQSYPPNQNPQNTESSNPYTNLYNSVPNNRNRGKNEKSSRPYCPFLQKGNCPSNRCLYYHPERDENSKNQSYSPQRNIRQDSRQSYYQINPNSKKDLYNHRQQNERKDITRKFDKYPEPEHTGYVPTPNSDYYRQTNNAQKQHHHHQTHVRKEESTRNRGKLPQPLDHYPYPKERKMSQVINDMIKEILPYYIPQVRNSDKHQQQPHVNPQLNKKEEQAEESLNPHELKTVGQPNRPDQQADRKEMFHHNNYSTYYQNQYYNPQQTPNVVPTYSEVSPQSLQSYNCEVTQKNVPKKSPEKNVCPPPDENKMMSYPTNDQLNQLQNPKYGQMNMPPNYNSQPVHEIQQQLYDRTNETLYHQYPNHHHQYYNPQQTPNVVSTYSEVSPQPLQSYNCEVTQKNDPKKAPETNVCPPHDENSRMSHQTNDQLNQLQNPNYGQMNMPPNYNSQQNNSSQNPFMNQYPHTNVTKVLPQQPSHHPQLYQKLEVVPQSNIHLPIYENPQLKPKNIPNYYYPQTNCKQLCNQYSQHDKIFPQPAHCSQANDEPQVSIIPNENTNQCKNPQDEKQMLPNNLQANNPPANNDKESQVTNKVSH